ncbi:50S ribosomal protein L24 [Alkalispirochaeta sphaeroplastigenens]|uniref:Large ribosomal subunit protein uL24 n=1 Tax=Alkalispirochaeta sphaeroplastigenens TaxID=1187066 RepID=A0A2S4JGU4_9SPIO|nr:MULTISPECIES: 50S ribosomal protein L24 [Alkalispirochaeta]POQ98768.1 50S ribosomal protein L24 [Alkalispirochaeta sphaeroplastigenens]
MKTKLKKDDTVMVVAGKDKGKTGKILKIDRAKNRVLVEGVNLVKKAQKKRSQEDAGGIIEREASIDISNVMFLEKDGKPSRLGYRVEGDAKVRFSRRTGETI